MKNSSLIAIAALISNTEAHNLKGIVQFNLPDGSELVYEDDISEQGDPSKIELIVSDFGGNAPNKKHHHHMSKQTNAQVSQ